MRTRVRLALLALLIAGAAVALRLQVAADPPAALERDPPAETGGTARLLVLLGVPMLAVVLFTALRYRRPKHAPLDPRLWRPPGWRRPLVALLGVVLFATLLATLAQVTAPEIRPEPGSTGGPGTDDPTAPEPPRDGVDVSGPETDGWAIALAVTLLLLLAVLLLARRAVAPGYPQALDGQPAEPDEQQLAEAARRALSAVDTPSDDARAAIIACYRAMERSLAESPHGAPRPADTPSDVLRRATETGLLRGPGGARLVALFAEARYSSHAMTEHDRELAVSALRSILDEAKEPV